MSIYTVNDPMDLISKTANRIWPEVQAVVHCDLGLVEMGESWMCVVDDNGDDVILLNPSLSIHDMAQSLAEAITSIKIGTNISIHSDEFIEMLESLINSYESRSLDIH